MPVVFTIIGAAAGADWPALARLRSYVLHFAAGVVFSVVAVELLPEIQRRAESGGAPVRDVVLGFALGFALGIGTMLAADRLLDRMRDGGGDDDDTPAGGEVPADRPRAAGIPLAAATSHAAPGAVNASLLVALGIDSLLDGLLLGAGFAAGARIGILLALAEAAEQLAVGLALSGELARAGVARPHVLLIVPALGLLVFVSAVLGATVLGRLTSRRQRDRETGVPPGVPGRVSVQYEVRTGAEGAGVRAA